MSPRSRGGRRTSAGASARRALATLTLLAACEPATEPAAPEIRPVRVMSVEEGTSGDTVALTGTVQAETEVNLGFRIGGRLIERLVNVGDRVAPRPARCPARRRGRGERAARGARRSRRGDGAAGRGAEQLRAPEDAVRGRLDHPGPLR